MVTIRKTSVSSVIPVQTQARLEKAQRRREFLARTEGKVWDSETEQFVENDDYNKSELELAGDFVIAENEYYDNLPDEDA
jgi:hypothetical protein